MGKLITSSAARTAARNPRVCSHGLAVALPILCGLGLALPAFSQSAANFDTKSLAPPAGGANAAATAKQAAAATAEAGPVSAMPSRLVGPQDLDAYVVSLESIFQMRGRAHDPFGHAQDPDAKPPIKASATPMAHRFAAAQATPLSDIVSLIVVTTIMPGEKSFLVGTREFKQGDQVPITFRGKPIRLQITEVNSRQIGFRNLETGEFASRKLDMLPIGMTPGTRGITAPGMVADRPNAPLELETREAEPLSNR